MGKLGIKLTQGRRPERGVLGASAKPRTNQMHLGRMRQSFLDLGFSQFSLGVLLLHSNALYLMGMC